MPEGPVIAEFTGKDAVVNTATAEGCAVDDPSVCDDDDDTARYYGLYWAFTPGFWKNHWGNPDKPNQKNAWVYTAYSDTDLACYKMVPGMSVFGCEYRTLTLLQALQPQSFHKEEGYSQLLRAGTAALLNASFHEVNHGDIYGPDGLVYFPLYSAEVIQLVKGAINSEDIASMLALAETLDSYNNGLHWINWGPDGPLP
jgi:hypothetical protein